MQTTTAVVGGKGSNPKTVLYVGGKVSSLRLHQDMARLYDQLWMRQDLELSRLSLQGLKKASMRLNYTQPSFPLEISRT